MVKEIKITCKGSDYLPLERLKNFQGELKTIGKQELEKIKKSIKKIGFSFPVFIWNDEILDGHQRIKAVKELISEGWVVGPVPVVEIFAENRADAAEKLLRLNSHHAKMTDESLIDFLKDNEVDMLSLFEDLSLPDINIENVLSFFDADGPKNDESQNDNTGNIQDNYAEQYGVIVICSDEKHQEEIYNLLNEQGLNCKVVNT